MKTTTINAIIEAMKEQGECEASILLFESEALRIESEGF